MRNNKNQNNNKKSCPFLDKTCVGNECAIFNEKFERCEVGLLTYNLYLVQERLKQWLDPNRK
jgi:hypothetical protein